jgi:hypothetical protein
MLHAMYHCQAASQHVGCLSYTHTKVMAAGVVLLAVYSSSKFQSSVYTHVIPGMRRYFMMVNFK